MNVKKIASSFTSLAVAWALALMLAPQQVGANFSDLNIEIPDNAAVGYLVNEKVIEGYPNGTFQGDEGMNRAELTKVLVVGQGIDPDSEAYRDCFDDVQAQWFAPYVCYAKEQNWVEGYPDGKFLPGDPVNQAEAYKIILEPIFGDAAEGDFDVSKLSDVDSEDWFANYVGFAYEKNLLSEPHFIDTRAMPFEPGRDATRFYVSDLLARSMMMSQGNWSQYHPYYQDELLLEMGLDQLVTENYPCYQIEEAPHDIRVFEQYTQEKHGISDVYELPQGQLLNPFASMACYSGTGKTFMVYNTDNGPALEIEAPEGTHLKVFDANESTFCADVFSDYKDLQTLLLQADAQTLEMVNCYYLKDKENVYYLDKYTEDGFVILEDVDPATFEMVESDIAFTLARSGDQLYYLGLLVENFDLETMSLLDGNYIQKEGEVYFVDSIYIYQESTEFKLNLLKDVSPDDLEVLKFELPETSGSLTADFHSGRWAMAGSKLYFGDVPVQVEDKDSFEVVSAHYAKDNQNVYSIFDFPSSLQPKPDKWVLTDQEADVSSFDVLVENQFPTVTLAMDKDMVYYNGEPVSTDPLDLSTVSVTVSMVEGFILEDSEGYSCAFQTEGYTCLES